MTELRRPATNDGLFLWVMHRFARDFEEHAILKGGMALRLLDSPRHTNDIDYVFVPYASKRDGVDLVAQALSDLADAQVEIGLHSKMIRALIRLDDASIQVEIDVARDCASTPMATGGFALALGVPSQIVRVMHHDTALAHKLAAWNERRLLRDLFDCYFLAGRVGASIDLAALDTRLRAIESRLPQLRKRKHMERSELAKELKDAVASLGPEKVDRELGGLIPPEELAGLHTRMKVTLNRIAEGLVTLE